MKVLDDSSCFGDGQCWPPGFRFHPTDEELVIYYLKRKICRRRLKLDIIGETDVYKWDPEELPGQSKLRTRDRQWFFFSPRERKYPNGARSKRATSHGYWKATGKDRNITCNSRLVGVKKTLVFHKGRAPTGDRTDWVMHEYTLDEEELKRCQAAQDYYALYKVFKKSGLGPKNGEQYGAPFREEDWADDENSEVNVCVDQENLVQQFNDIVAVDNTKANGEVQSPLKDLEEFMNCIVDDPVLAQPLAANYAYAVQEVVGGEETRGTLVDQPLREANLHEQSIVHYPSRQQNDVQASFDLTQSATSQLQCYETSEVTSAPNIYGQEPCATDEDFLEDFIEMDDLIGPEPAIQNIEKPVENLQFEEIDGLCELDLIQDAVMFLRDMGPINLEPVSHSYFNNIGNEMVSLVESSYLNDYVNEVVNPVSNSYQNNLETGMVRPVSPSCFNNLDNEMSNPLDYQLQPYSNDASQISSQLWMHDQKCDNVIPAQSNQGAIPSGVVCDGSSAILPAEVNQSQNQNANEDDGGDSWISSVLWSFVESIPTTPASASENALFNKAFERMSGFGRTSGRVRISAGDGDTSLAAGNPAATLRSSSSRYNRGFFLFSVIGVVCAILWVLIGTSVRVLAGCLPS